MECDDSVFSGPEPPPEKSWSFAPKDEDFKVPPPETTTPPPKKDPNSSSHDKKGPGKKDDDDDDDDEIMKENDDGEEENDEEKDWDDSMSTASTIFAKNLGSPAHLISKAPPPPPLEGGTTPGIPKETPGESADVETPPSSEIAISSCWSATSSQEHQDKESESNIETRKNPSDSSSSSSSISDKVPEKTRGEGGGVGETHLSGPRLTRNHQDQVINSVTLTGKSLSEINIADFYPSLNNSQEFCDLDILVCGKCRNVFHLLDEFKSHRISCHRNPSSSSADKEYGIVEMSKNTDYAIALVFWSNAIKRQLLQSGISPRLIENEDASLTQKIHSSWAKLSRRGKKNWINAAKALKELGKAGKIVFGADQMEKLLVEKEPTPKWMINENVGDDDDIIVSKNRIKKYSLLTPMTIPLIPLPEPLDETVKVKLRKKKYALLDKSDKQIGLISTKTFKASYESVSSQTTKPKTKTSGSQTIFETSNDKPLAITDHRVLKNGQEFYVIHRSGNFKWMKDYEVDGVLIENYQKDGLLSTLQLTPAKPKTSTSKKSSSSSTPVAPPIEEESIESIREFLNEEPPSKIVKTFAGRRSSRLSTTPKPTTKTPASTKKSKPKPLRVKLAEEAASKSKSTYKPGPKSSKESRLSSSSASSYRPGPRSKRLSTVRAYSKLNKWIGSDDGDLEVSDNSSSETNSSQSINKSGPTTTTTTIKRGPGRPPKRKLEQIKTSPSPQVQKMSRMKSKPMGLRGSVVNNNSANVKKDNDESKSIDMDDNYDKENTLIKSPIETEEKKQEQKEDDDHNDKSNKKMKKEEDNEPSTTPDPVDPIPADDDDEELSEFDGGEGTNSPVKRINKEKDEDYEEDSEEDDNEDLEEGEISMKKLEKMRAQNKKILVNKGGIMEIIPLDKLPLNKPTSIKTNVSKTRRGPILKKVDKPPKNATPVAFEDLPDNIKSIVPLGFEMQKVVSDDGKVEYRLKKKLPEVKETAPNVVKIGREATKRKLMGDIVVPKKPAFDNQLIRDTFKNPLPKEQLQQQHTIGSGGGGGGGVVSSTTTDGEQHQEVSTTSTDIHLYESNEATLDPESGLMMDKDGNLIKFVEAAAPESTEPIKDENQQIIMEQTEIVVEEAAANTTKVLLVLPGGQMILTDLTEDQCSQLNIPAGQLETTPTLGTTTTEDGGFQILPAEPGQFEAVATTGTAYEGVVTQPIEQEYQYQTIVDESGAIVQTDASATTTIVSADDLHHETAQLLAAGFEPQVHHKIESQDIVQNQVTLVQTLHPDHEQSNLIMQSVEDIKTSVSSS